MTKTNDPGEHLPFKPTVLHILLSLSAGRSHGYEIMQTVDERTRGTVRMSTAVLYRTLSRLLERGLIAESARRPDPDEDDRRRRYYEITPVGQMALTLELERLREVLSSRSAIRILEAADAT